MTIANNLRGYNTLTFTDWALIEMISKEEVSFDLINSEGGVIAKQKMQDLNNILLPTGDTVLHSLISKGTQKI